MEAIGLHLAVPAIQYGFAGMCVLLLIFIFMQSRQAATQTNQLIELVKETNKVISDNTIAFRDFTGTLAQQQKIQGDTVEMLKDVVLQRRLDHGNSQA